MTTGDEFRRELRRRVERRVGAESLDRLRLTPYGMATCCVCDAPTTHAIPTDAGELLPYCLDDAAALKAEFPDSEVYLYQRVELDPGDHVDADRPPGTSGSWGER